MNIEARLSAKIGEAGKRLHTGRSRNDQVALDVRLYLAAEVEGLIADLSGLRLAGFGNIASLSMTTTPPMVRTISGRILNAEFIVSPE